MMQVGNFVEPVRSRVCGVVVHAPVYSLNAIYCFVNTAVLTYILHVIATSMSMTEKAHDEK